MAAAVRIVPSLTLRGVDHNEVYAMYMRGDFSTRSSSSVKAEDTKLVEKKITPLQKVYGADVSCSTYSFVDLKSNRFIYHMTGTTVFEFVKTNGVLPTEGKCVWCRRSFKHTILGTPISTVQDKITIYIGMSPVLMNIFVCHFIDSACGDRCSYAWASYDPECIRCNSSEQVLMIRSMMHPDAPPLVMAPDWRLLDSNGGSLTAEEFDGERCIYVKTPNVVMLPMKVPYLKRDA